MGFAKKLLKSRGVVALAALIGDALQEDPETKRRREEEQRRRESPLRFDEGVTQAEFVDLASRIAKRTPRLDGIDVAGMTVTLYARSLSGLSTWTAEVDFSDFGHLTGAYWWETENSQSRIPEHFADAMQRELQARFRGASPTKSRATPERQTPPKATSPQSMYRPLHLSQYGTHYWDGYRWVPMPTDYTWDGFQWVRRRT